MEMIGSPSGDDVGQLGRVGCYLDRDWLKEHELLLGADGVSAGGHVLQTERTILLCHNLDTGKREGKFKKQR